MLPTTSPRLSRSLAQVLTSTLTLTLLMGVALGNDRFKPQEIRDIEKFAGDIMGCANIPGLAIGVVRGDSTFTTGLGITDMVTAHPVDNKTIFNLGSTSKAFVPYVLAEIMNGKENKDGRDPPPVTRNGDRITWNSTLGQLLKGDPEVIVPPRWSDLRLKDMLIYKSGDNAADMATMVGLPEGTERADYIRRLRFVPDNFKDDHPNHYSNIMYTIAGYLAERLTGSSWEELVKTRVLDKQDMMNSLLAPKGLTTENAARSYRFQPALAEDPFVEQDATLFNLHPAEPVGSLMASADDITKWVRHLLHNLHLKVNGSGVNMLIEDAFVRSVPVSQEHNESVIHHESEVPLGYGMGWFASTYRDQRRFRYSGRLYASQSQIWLFPDIQAAVFVVMNGPGNEDARKALETILYHISDITTHQLNWVDSDMACGDEDYADDFDFGGEDGAPLEQKQINFLAPLEMYTGKYGNGLVGNVVIEATAGGVLALSLGKNLKGELTPDDTEANMTFTTTSVLLNTEEWATHKQVQFYNSHTSDDGKIFQSVRLYLTDTAFYEFHRGQLFETAVIRAEEEERLEKERLEAAKTRPPTPKVQPEHEDNAAGSAERILMSTEGPQSGSHENKVRPKTDLKDQPYSVDGQGDDPASVRDEQGQEPDAGRKIRDKNSATSKPDNSCSKLSLSFLSLFLSAVVSFVLTKT